MRADDIAAMLNAGMQAPQGDSDISLHQGVIQSWDRRTGLNTVLVNGTSLSNLSALQGGIPNAFATGDVVLVCRKQSRYFILGKVAAPGGLAGSAPAFQSSNAGVTYTTGTSGAWVDLTGFVNTPQVQTYIGSNRTALVTWQCDIDVLGGLGEVGWRVDGASTIAPGAFNSMTIKHGQQTFNQSGSMTVKIQGTFTGAYLIGPGAGLNQGDNTFTMKYRTTIYDAVSGSVRFGSPSLNVIPL